MSVLQERERYQDVQERYRSVQERCCGSAAAETVSGSVAGAGASCGSCSSEQRPGALQERPVAPAAAETRSGALQERPVAPTGASRSVWERYRSVLWLVQQQKHVRPGSVPGASCGSCSSRNTSGSVTGASWALQERPAISIRERAGACPVAPAAAETASGSVTGASCGSCSSRNTSGSVTGASRSVTAASRSSVWERYRSVLWLLQQQIHVSSSPKERRQERPVAAAETRYRKRPGARSVTAASRSSYRSVRSVLWLLQQQEQCPGALQERPVAPAAAETAVQRSVTGVSRTGPYRFRHTSRSITGAFRERYRSVLWLLQQQKQCRGSVTGALL